MSRRRNPFAHRRAPSARALRRAAALSPRQSARAIGRLKSNANRLISEGLREKMAAREEPPAD